jgi:hypothetical protein
MIRAYTAEEALEMLKRRQGTKTQREFAAEIGVTQQYLGDVLLGNRGIGTKLLTYLGLEVGYIKKQA